MRFTKLPTATITQSINRKANSVNDLTTQQQSRINGWNQMNGRIQRASEKEKGKIFHNKCNCNQEANEFNACAMK